MLTKLKQKKPNLPEMKNQLQHIHTANVQLVNFSVGYFEGPQGSSIQSSQPKFSCNPVIPMIIFGIPHCTHIPSTRGGGGGGGNPSSRLMVMWICAAGWGRIF